MTNDIAIADDYGPFSLGFSGLPSESDPVEYEQALVKTLETIDGHIESADDYVKQILGECLSQCESINGNCHDCMVGNVIRYIEQAEKIIAKIDGKMIDALIGIVTESQQALGTVDQIASHIQQGGGDETVTVEAEMNPQTVEQLNYNAAQAGEIYRNTVRVIGGNAGSGGDTGDTPIGANPPGGIFGVDITPPEQLPDGCRCPDGTSWTALKGTDGKTYWGCRAPGSFEVVQPICEPVPPDPPTDPTNGCIELEDILPACGITEICNNGVPVGIDYIQKCCWISYIKNNPRFCYDIIGVEPPPEEPEPEPPTTSTENESCELLSPDDQIDEYIDYETGSLNEFGQELSTETNPIWIPDPNKIGVFVELPIGTPSPLEPPPATKNLTYEEMIAQALRNDGKVQVCNAKQIPFERQEPGGLLHDYDYCSLDKYKNIDKAIDDYKSVADTLCEGPLGGITTTANKVYKILTGGESYVGVLGSPVLAGVAALISKEMVKNCFYQKVFANVFTGPAGCNYNGEKLNATIRQVAGYAASKLGSLSPSQTKSVEYLTNYNCQYLLPSADDFDAAYLSGRIDKDQWEFGQKVHGYCVDWKEKVVDAGRPTPDFRTIFGWERAEVEEPDKVTELLKRVGIVSEQDRENFEYISHQIPPVTDLIRFMLRDVADESVVEKYKYMDGFEQKFDGKLKEYALRQNLTEEAVKLYWAAHWQLPSVGQAFEMYHRLRPEKELGNLETGKIEFTRDDLKELLKINDLAPGFVDRFIEISYRPLGLRQIGRAYETNTITSKDATGYYQDLGYNPNDAKTLTEYLQVDSAERRAKFLGKPLPSEMEKYYVQGLIGEETYTQELYNAGFPETIVDERVRHGRVKAAVGDSIERVKATKRRYLRGEIDDNEYLRKLISLGVDNERARQIVERDRDVKGGKNREIQIGKLCKLVQQGLLAPADYFTRAMNYGYKVEDAALLVQSCMIEYQEALNKKTQAAIRAAASDAAKIQAAKEREEKRLEKERLAALPCRPKPKPLCPV